MRSYKDLNITYRRGELDLSQSLLTSLEGCPNVITGDFYCTSNYLTTLVGGPQQVDGDYLSSGNSLTDLVGCASHIGGTLYIKRTNITSLIGIHKIIKSCQKIFLNTENITQGGIGLLLINDLFSISDGDLPFKIIRSYIGQGTKGMMECSKELIANGYAQFAKL